MLAQPQPRQFFVQPNTFLLDNGDVVIKEYEPIAEGMIQSWAERAV